MRVQQGLPGITGLGHGGRRGLKAAVSGDEAGAVGAAYVEGEHERELGTWRVMRSSQGKSRLVLDHLGRWWYFYNHNLRKKYVTSRLDLGGEIESCL